MLSAWDGNAERRHAQIVTGLDVSLTDVALPAIKHLLTPFFNKGLRLLDLGCGSGFLVRELSPYFKHLHGVDPSEQSIGIAHNYLNGIENITIQNISLTQIESREKFDIVLSHATLHVIDEIEAELISIRNILLPRATFLFSIPHPAFWLEYKNLKHSYVEVKEFKVPFTITNDRNPLPQSVPYIHRSLSAYSDILSSAGFIIKKLAEPFPTEKVQKKFAVPWSFPHFLFFHCERET